MMDVSQARSLIEESMPRSIERARKLLRKEGCDIDGAGRVSLEDDGAAAWFELAPDPLAPAGMDFVPGGAR